MRLRTALMLILPLIIGLAAHGKDRKRVVLPADVVEARTVWVIVDPGAGIDVKDPNANNLARAAVENALAKWGRLKPTTEGSTADLVIVVRKGNGKMVNSTIGGTPANDPPPLTGQRTDSGINGSGRVSDGRPSFGSDPHPQMEVGGAEDVFSVYRGNRTGDPGYDPLDKPPVWRYSARDALAAPGVPAVEEFRKVVLTAEKQLAKP